MVEYPNILIPYKVAAKKSTFGSTPKKASISIFEDFFFSVFLLFC